MNLLGMISRKPFSFGAIFFIWLPLLCGCALLTVYGLKYWYLALAAFSIMLMIIGTQVDTQTTDLERQDQEIQAHRDALRSTRIELLDHLGHPADNGQWAPWQASIWDEIHELDRKEVEFLDRTEVVNLDPLGHNIGRVYKNQRKGSNG